ncbi:uncharacterized protein LOC143174997 [Nomia melanderi]|uniref:uncharacterized protein LOC143174997 n=1 Tax=Nomia melanderi TaxID=2448451 RepID=UPI003FCE3241
MTLRTLEWTITILTVLGCQRPSTWSSASKRFFYNAYTLLVLILVQNLLVSAILDLMLNVDNQDDFSDNLFSTIAIVVSSFKLCSFLTNRESIAVLTSSLAKEPFLPVNREEYEIRTRFDKMIETRSIRYTAAIEVCIAFTWISTLIIDGRNRKLAFRVWIPYNYSSLSCYSVTYIQHVTTG